MLNAPRLVGTGRGRQRSVRMRDRGARAYGNAAHRQSGRAGQRGRQQRRHPGSNRASSIARRFRMPASRSTPPANTPMPRSPAVQRRQLEVINRASSRSDRCRQQAFIANRMAAATSPAACLRRTSRPRLQGPLRLGSAFHLRPGVEIDSATPNGNLIVSGDVTSGNIDLSSYPSGPSAHTVSSRLA